MKVKRSLLTLCFAAGLSLSVLQGYGYSQTSESTVPTANDTAPQETVSNENSEQNFYILLLLLNIIALLGAIGTCAFLVYKNNKLNQINKEDNAFLIKLEPEEDQQTSEQIQAKKRLDANLKDIQESLQGIKDTLIDDSVSLLSNKNNTPLIDLTKAKYTQLIDLINRLGYLLDDTYIAMLKYNNFTKYDKDIELTIETIQQSISEHIKGLENRNQDNNRIDQHEIKRAIDNSLTTVKPKIDSILEKLQSFSSHNLQNATQASDNTLTEQTIQECNDRIHQLNDRIQELNIEREKYEKELQDERNQYEQEIQVKDDKIAELETGEIGKIQQKYDDLFKNYEKAYQYYGEYQTMKTERDNINTKLNNLTTKFNQVRQDLLKRIDEKYQQIQQKDNEINQLKGDVQRFKKIIDKKPTKNNRRDELNSELNEVKQELKEIIEQEEQEILGKREKIKGRKRDIPNDDTKNSDYSSQLQALVNLYMQNPEEIRNNATDEVMEDDDNLMERKMNPSRTLIFNHSKSPGGYYIIAVGDDYFLFPKQHGIPVSQKSTAREVFDGYKSGNTSKFTLIIPAQVIRCDNGRWQLINKGRLEYS
ncbi:MAG: hypothetical protein AB4057_01195 [Crocosphaera sp.]